MIGQPAKVLRPGDVRHALAWARRRRHGLRNQMMILLSVKAGLRAAEIAGLQPPPDITGYSAEFQYRIFGHPLRASSYPPRIVLFKPTAARYVDDGHTQTLWIRSAGSQELRPPKDSDRIGKLSGKIYHDDRKPLSHWIQAQDRYATIEARHLLIASLDQLSFQDRLRRQSFFAAPAMFLYLLFARGLILDGWPGWFYVFQRTLAEIILSLRLIEHKLGSHQ